MALKSDPGTPPQVPTTAEGVPIVSLKDRIESLRVSNTDRDPVPVRLSNLQAQIDGDVRVFNSPDQPLVVLGHVQLADSEVRLAEPVEIANVVKVEHQGRVDVSGSKVELDDERPINVRVQYQVPPKFEKPLEVEGAVIAFQGGPWTMQLTGLDGGIVISDGGGSITVDGAVSILGGTVQAEQSGSWEVSITGMPTVVVDGTVEVTGSVDVSGSTVGASQVGSWTFGSSQLPAALGVNGGLKVSIVDGGGGGGSGTEYLEGTNVPAPTGNVPLWLDGSDDVLAVRLTSAFPVQPGTGAVFAISAASLPLPAGAAEETTLADLNSKVLAVDTDDVAITATVLAADAATETKQDAGNASLASIDAKITAVNTGAVVVASSALPSGASTSANQSTIIGHLDGVEGLLTTIDADTGAIATSVASLDGKVTACNTGAVTISAALPTGTNSIGQVTANAGTNLNTSALALESGGNLATIAGAIRAEDSASADGHTGVVVMAVRKGTPANTSGTDGDYEALQVSAGRIWASATIDAALPAGSNTIGNVGIAASQTIAVTDGAGSLTVDGSVSVANTVAVAQSGAWVVTANAGTGTFTIGDGGSSITVDSAQLPAALGQTTMAGSLAVAIASDQSAIPVSDGGGALTVDNGGTFAVQASITGGTVVATQATTWTVTHTKSSSASHANVASSASSVTLLSSNSSRVGCYIYNDSTQILRIKFGSSASATSMVLPLKPQGVYEMPQVSPYTGIITGIWDSADGSARVTELT